MKTMFCPSKPKTMIANMMTDAIDHGPAADNKGSAIAKITTDLWGAAGQQPRSNASLV